MQLGPFVSETLSAHGAARCAPVHCLSRALVLAGLLVGCGIDDSGGTSGGPDSEEQGTCYFETISNYWCTDGTSQHGTWSAECSAIAQGDCGPIGDLAGGQDPTAECTYETQFRRIQWVSAEACNRMLQENILDPDGTPCAYHEDCQSGCCAQGCAPVSACGSP